MVSIQVSGSSASDKKREPLKATLYVPKAETIIPKKR
jgi:hypothetical protein